MTERIILSLVAIFMLSLTLKKGDKKSKLLTAGLTLGILITWTGISTLITAGFILYMLTGLIIPLSNFKRKDLSKLHWMTIVIGGIFAFGGKLFSIMNWPYASEIRLSMIIPIALYLLSLFKGLVKRKELGYSTIMNAEFIVSMIR